MNTNNTMTLSSSGYARMVELSGYSLLATALISQIFFVHGKATWPEVVLVLLGIALGIMASCTVTPIHNLLERHKQALAEWQWFKAYDPQIAVESRSSVTQDSQEQDTLPQADGQRHAA